MNTQVLLFYKGSSTCGNCSTATHLAEILRNKYRTQLAVVNNDGIVGYQDSSCTRYIGIGIHLYHSGRLLLELRNRNIMLPFILVVGGTDVNEYWADDNCRSTMCLAVASASYITCFSEDLHAKCINLFGDEVKSKLKVIKPGISVIPPLPNQWKEVLCNTLPLHNFQKYLILVANLRPVKDVLYLLHSFSQFVSESNLSVALVIVGGILDSSYGDKVLTEVANLTNVFYIDSCSKADTHALISGASALVNSSRSEGVSVAILEAMCLRTLVLARAIPGNLSVVTHMENGLLFSDQNEFCCFVRLILRDEHLCSKLIDSAYVYVKENHSTDVERSHYENICDEIALSDILSK